MTMEQVRNLALASDVGRSNLLVNGGFEVWQRGPGPFTTNVMTTDYWRLPIFGTDTAGIQKNTSAQDSAYGSATCAAVTFTMGNGGGNTSVMQKVYTRGTDDTGISGRMVSTSVRVSASVANAVRCCLSPDGTPANAGGLVSGYHQGDGQYHTLTITGLIPSGWAQVYFAINFGVSGTFYLDNAMLVLGSQPADYAPLHPTDDLARCLRYYEVVGSVPGTLIVRGWAGAGAQQIGGSIHFKATKAGTPSVTPSTGASWTLTNCTGPTFGAIGVGMFDFYVTASSANQVTVYNNSTNPVIAEVNP